MEQEKVLYKTERVALKETHRGFQFLERKGKDSVAIFLIRRNPLVDSKLEVLIRYQPLCVDNSEINGVPRLFACPLTGSISGDESPEVAASREAFEEAGYSVQVLPLGNYIVGTQTNEVCYMYYADVTALYPQTPPQDGSYFESISKNEWQPLDYLQECEFSACQLGYFRLKALYNWA